MKVDVKKIKKVLIIRHKAIGDIILVTPFIRAIKKAIPEAEIDMVIEPMGIEVLDGNPYLHKAVIFEKNKLKKANLFVKIYKSIIFYKSLIDSKYDIVFDLWGNLRTALMTFITGARYRVGFNFRGRKYFYNNAIKPYPVAIYNAAFHTELLRAIGISDDGEKTDFYVHKADNEFADKFYESIGKKSGDVVVGLNGAGSWITKRWPEYKFAQLADMFVEKYKDKKVVIVWGPNEKPMAEKIYELMKKEKKDVFLAPDTTLKQLGALLLQMNVFVSNDGSPNHIAVALDVPSVTVLGPTNYKSWVPANNARHLEVHSTLSCAPCDKMTCPTKIECMNGIEVKNVFEKVKILIKM